jgi:penicillin-insensitive murein endopeptidase
MLELRQAMRRPAGKIGVVSVFAGALLALAPLDLARAGANLWSQITTPRRGAPRSIGGYSSGCVQGAHPLPLDGVGYQVMRPQRHRNFGHPRLVEYVRNLGKAVKEAGLGNVLIGDLGQPRGGPAPTGHASHQSGLDVDVWYWSPELAATRKLSAKEREELSAQNVVNTELLSIGADYDSRVSALLRLATRDEQVARIFVNPVVKHTLCREQRQERAFLAKLRPWWGHDEHFHVRLACPPDSPLCEAQSPIPAGDGCEEVASWLTPEALAERAKDRVRYRAKIGKAPGQPPQCQALLQAK